MIARSEIPAPLKWDLREIYADEELWERDALHAEECLATWKSAPICTGPADLLKALEQLERLGALVNRLFRYPNLSLEVGVDSPQLRGLKDRARHLTADYGGASAMLMAVVSNLGHGCVKGWCQELPELRVFEQWLDLVFASSRRVEVSQTQLALLKSAQVQAYGALLQNDSVNQATLSDGRELVITPASIRAVFDHEPLQADRARVFEAAYAKYDAHKHVYAAMLEASCRARLIEANANGFETISEFVLHQHGMPIELLDSLIVAVQENTATFQDHHRTRKERLGLKRYHFFDTFYGLSTFEERVEYDEAKYKVRKALEALGEEYVACVDRAFSNRWIDVYPHEGKSPRTYATSVAGVHPFILLNYQSGLNDVFSLAHELGHAVHAALSSEGQLTFEGSFPLCEVPSLLNELLLADAWLTQATRPEEQSAITEQMMIAVTGNMAIPAIHLDFERRIHGRVESGMTLGVDVLRAIWDEVAHTYFGDSLDPHPLYNLTWARLGSLHSNPYYNYPYALSWLVASELKKALVSSSPAIREEGKFRFLNFLQTSWRTSVESQIRDLNPDLMSRLGSHRKLR